MADIKTRDLVKGTVKTIDKAAVAGQRMKAAYISTKQKAEHSTHAAESSAEEYASDRYEAAVDRLAHEGAHQLDKAGRRAFEETKDTVKDQVEKFKQKRAEKAAEQQKQARSNTVDNPVRTNEHPVKTADNPVRQTSDNAVRTSEKGIKTADRAVSEPVRDTGKNAVETGRKGTAKGAEKSIRQSARSAGEKTIKTTEQVSQRTVRTAEHTVQRTAKTAGRTAEKTARAAGRTAEKTVKQTARSTGKKTIKTVSKGTAKTVGKSVKTAERTAKTTIKTTQKAAQAAQKTAQAAAKAAQKAAQAAKMAAKAAVAAVKLLAKATVAAVKAIIAATKALISAIAAGGWVAVIVIIVICLVALILGSVFGIFFSGEDSGTGQSMQTAVAEINTEYDNKLLEIRNSVSYDVLEMSGSRAVWKEVLAVYAVKTNTDPDNPQEVATMDDGKKQLLTDIFWEMNDISYRTDSITSNVITETDDGAGNIVETETEVTEVYLYITVSHKTADEMAEQYGFNQEQKDYLTELLKDENNQLWFAVLYGITAADDQIVAVALSQLGNIGGEPYWSWYGFTGRVEWCACFVSWCANECGYIETGIIPKFAGCSNGIQWFKDRDQWAAGSIEPMAGTLIFFDWDDEDTGQDGVADHVGIVEKVENGIVYTVEGNSGDSCRQRQYAVGHYEIFGYGIPAY